MQVEGGGSTVGLPRDGPVVPFASAPVKASRDHPEGAFAEKVKLAKEQFKVGNLFEAVLSQTFVEPCPAPPSELFRRTRVRNPAPFGFLMNLGSCEYLVGASPEMYVRVQSRRVETCPISGTIKRGRDAIADAGQILELLSVSCSHFPQIPFALLAQTCAPAIESCGLYLACRARRRSPS